MDASFVMMGLYRSLNDAVIAINNSTSRNAVDRLIQTAEAHLKASNMAPQDLVELANDTPPSKLVAAIMAAK